MHPFRPTPKVSPFALPIWVQRAPRRLAALLMLVVGISIGVPTVEGCGQPVLPIAAAITNVVANDLAQGKSDAQIASDVCQALGGTSTQDAVCASVETLIQDAITLLIDTGVIKTPQGPRQVPPEVVASARAYRARHPLPEALRAPPQAVGQ